jgi:fatty-acid desaturase
LKHQGWSVEDIAVNLKVSPSTVRKYLREKPSSEKVTFTVMKKDKPQSPQDRKEIVVMYLMPFVWIPLMGVMLFLWDSLWSVLLSIVFIVFIYKGIVNHMRGKRK